MKRYSAVIFPETVPDEQVLVPLVHVFQPLVYCRPVETEPGDNTEGSPLVTGLLRHSLVRIACPAPLGPDRERFLHLLSDLRHRGGEYSAQLTHVSLAGLGPAGRKKTETKSSIISDLLKRHGIEGDEGRDRRAMLLWQARLVLKLGEFMEADQRALAREIQSVTEREKGLFAQLREETEGPFSMTERLSSVRSDENGMQRLLLKAWSRIFALGSSSPEQEHIFVTRNSDAVDRLAEEYARINGVRPGKIVSLALPARPGDSETLIAGRDRFDAEAIDFLEDLSGLLSGSARKMDCADQFTAKGEGSWQAILENHFPVDTCGRCRLDLYDFGPVCPGQLFLDSFGFDEDQFQTEPVKKAEAGLIIGTLAHQTPDPTL